MMRFPITELLSEADCYHYLLELLHPDGLAVHMDTPFLLSKRPINRSAVS